MAEYPEHLVCNHVLADGRTVTIRPIRRDDDELERQFLAALSAESRYLRFHKAVGVPSDRLVHLLMDVDYDRKMALVCTTAGAAGEELAGEARYVTEPDGRSCDFGIMIADRWRKTGVAGLLMEALMRVARSRGIVVMESRVLGANRMMLRFARALGFTVEPVPDDPRTRRIVKRLL